MGRRSGANQRSGVFEVKCNAQRSNITSLTVIFPKALSSCSIADLASTISVVETGVGAITIAGIPPPRGWTRWLNRPQTAAEVEALGVCVKRGKPFGDEHWTERTARELGLDSTLRPRRRQRIRPIKDSRPLDFH